MGIIAEQWQARQGVQLKVHRLSAAHRVGGAIVLGAPAAGEALLFRDCASVHGWLMRSVLDVAFLDGDLRVIKTGRLRPWRVLVCRGAAHTLELRDGECARLGIAAGARMKKISS